MDGAAPRLAREFRSLASDFRSIRVVDDADGLRRVSLLCADAARLLKRAQEAGYLLAEAEIEWPHPEQLCGEVAWSATWQAIWSGLARMNPDWFRRDVGGFRFEPALGESNGRMSAGRGPRACDWHSAAVDHARLSEFVAEEIEGSEAPLDATPRGWLGGDELAQALGVPEGRRGAFLKAVNRARTTRRLPDSDWKEDSDRRANQAQFLYRADAPEVVAVAAKYR